MTLPRQFAVFIVAVELCLSVACHKTKPQLPAQMQAPTIAVSVPDQIPEIEPPPEPPPAQETTAEESTPKKAPAKRHSAKKPAQAATANPPNGQANTAVAANHPPANPAGEAPNDTAIAAAVPSQQLSQQKQTTADLLDSTEKDLKGLTRGLSHDEQTMLAQIKAYITQSRSATKEGDFERAYNLAMKAHLLADALIKK